MYKYCYSNKGAIYAKGLLISSKKVSPKSFTCFFGQVVGKSTSLELRDTNFFVPWSPKNLGDIPDFVEDFYSHIVLFKQPHFVRVVSPLAPFFDQQEPNMPMRSSFVRHFL